MSTSIRLPSIDNRIAARFPNKCIYCGSPSETTTQLKVKAEDRTTTYGRKHSTTTTKTYATEFAIPFCESHAEKSRHNNSLLRGIFIINMLIGIGLVIAFALQNPPIMGFFETKNVVYKLGAILIGLMAIVFFATLIAALLTSLAKYLLFPFNRTLRHQSRAGDGSLGIAIDFTMGRDALVFTFANTEMAREFLLLNDQGSIVNPLSTLLPPSPTTDFSQASKDLENKESGQDVANLSQISADIKQIVKRYEDMLVDRDKRLFFQPNIPSEKLLRPLKTFAPNVAPEAVLVLYDNTIRGHAKDGLLFTDTHLYAHSGSLKSVSIKLSDIKAVVYQEAFIGKLLINGMPFTEINYSREAMSSIFIRMVEEIVALFHSEQAKSSPT